jgi:hypothetical protein
MAAARPALIWRPPLWTAVPASGIVQSAAIRRCESELSLGGELCFRVGHRRRSRDDVNALPLRDSPACARIHGCHGDVLNGRQKVPARQLAPSPCDHAQEDAIPAHEVMIERRADMSSHKAGNGDTDEAMDEEKLLGECAALAPDRRQLE